MTKAEQCRINGCMGGRPKGSRNKPKPGAQYSLDQAIRADSAMTFNEIARRLGMSQSSAQFLYERGMAKLKRLPREHFAEFCRLAGAQRGLIDRRVNSHEQNSSGRRKTVRDGHKPLRTFQIAPGLFFTSLVQQSQEIIISDNESFVYWCTYLKDLTRAIGVAEKLKASIKEKVSTYRAAQEAVRKKEETEVLRQARALNQPAIVTKMCPAIENVHYRKALKWRVKNIKLVPRAYMVTDDKGITAAVKALGKDAKIRGIEVYDAESVVVTSQANVSPAFGDKYER